MALATLVVAVSFFRGEGAAQPPVLPHLARLGDLKAPDQATHAKIRDALRAAERVRSDTKQWPPALGVEGLTWTQRRHGVYVNYVGVPADPLRLRWLVLFIEPEPSPIVDPAPPEDDEHHSLPDGTALHVTVWTAANAGPVPEVVLPFPAAEGWTQRLR